MNTVDKAQYRERVNAALDYIEENLQNELDVPACAAAAGYAVHHFLRVFKKLTRFTPAEYVRKRRLAEIARRIPDDGEYMSELAFSYGFNSKENFTRAFRQEHGVNPTDYKRVKNSLKLFERIRFERVAGKEIEPEIVTLEPFTLVCFPPLAETPPKSWNEYNCKKLSFALSGRNDCMDYGVCSFQGKEMTYYTGIRAEDCVNRMDGMTDLRVPGGLYAVFATPPSTQADFVNEIHRTWGYLLNKWLPASKYRCADSYQFERYVESSRTFSEEIFIPVRER